MSDNKNSIPELKITGPEIKRATVELNISSQETPEKKKRRLLPPWLGGGAKNSASIAGSALEGSGSSFLTGGTLAGGAAGGGAAGGGGLLGTLFASKSLMIAVLAVSAGLVALGGAYLLKGDSAKGGVTANAPSLVNFGRSDEYSSGARERKSASSSDSLAMFAEKNRVNTPKPVTANAAVGDEKMPEETTPEAKADPDAVSADKMARLMDASALSNMSSSGGGGGGAGGAGPSLQNNALGKVSGGLAPSGMMASFQKPSFGTAGGMGGKRSLKASGSGASRSTAGRNAAAQARAIKGQLNSMGRTTSGDVAKAFTDSAWDGGTTDGAMAGDGMDYTGTPGISADSGNSSGNSSGDGSTTDPTETEIPEVSTCPEDSDDPKPDDPDEDSPWSSLSTIAMLLLMIANAIIIYIGIVGATVIGKVLAFKLAVIAAIIGGIVALMGVMMMFSEGQASQGATMATAGALTCAAGWISAVNPAWAAAWLAPVIAAVSLLVSMFGSMMGG